MVIMQAREQELLTPSYDRLVAEVDYLGNSVAYQYDTSDRPYKVISSVGSQTTTTYAWTGTNKPTLGVYGVTQTGNNGSVATTWYDKLGRVIRSEKKGFGGSMILTDTEYNAKGQVYRVSDPYFAGGSVAWAETYTTYDAYGRITAINRNTGRNTTYSYSSSTVSETTAGKTFSKTYGPDGTLTSATDNGGTINYAYFPDGKAKTITAPGGIVTSMLYADAARNQTQLVDPSAGTISYTYNSRGQIKTQTDARSRLTTYNYIDDGRTNTVVTPEETTTYSYNTNKQLTGITSPNSVSRTYGYDTKGRVNSVGETIAGTNFSTSFTFDSYGRLSTRTHPSGIVETLGYNSYGYMATISAGGSTRYTLTSMNAREQLTGATYGSNLTSAFGINMYGYPNSTITGSIQDYRYSFDTETGNLYSRLNSLRNKTESFSYDNLDRLTGVSGPQNLAMTFNANGNLSTKSDIGTTAFGYGASAGPYALTGVSSSTGVIPTTDQTATYTSFEKVSTLSERVYSASFIYNSENQRAKMTVTQSGSTILTRWYAGNSYMKETASGVTKEYTYLGGDAYTAPVAAVTQGGTTAYYYLLRDYLGNITHQVNTSNVVVAEYNFDAWGRRRSADDWSYTLDANDLALFVDRGFTSHEYLPWFNLYNMNGRLYDPLVGRFLSADPQISFPDFTQSYNRYSYCLNNPLAYTDPNGENPLFFIIGAIVGAYVGGSATNDCQWNPGKWDYNDPATYFGIIGGGLAGGFGAQWMFDPGGILAGGTPLNVSLGATFNNVGAAFANISVGGGSGIALQGLGYTTIAGGGAYIAGSTLNNWLNGGGGSTAMSPEQRVDQAIANAWARASNGGYTILLNRKFESANATISEFSVYGPSPLRPFNGYMLEPGGPSTTIRNQDRRIPTGTYNVNSYSSVRFPNVYQVSNSQVAADRHILIHSGNYHSNTSGCLLPGSSYSMVGTNYAVWNSGTTLNQLRTLLRTNNATLIINDSTPFNYIFGW